MEQCPLLCLKSQPQGWLTQPPPGECLVVALLCSSPDQLLLPHLSSKEGVEEQFWYWCLCTFVSSTPGLAAEHPVCQPPPPPHPFSGLGVEHLVSVVSLF